MGDHVENLYVRTHDTTAGTVGFALGKHFTDGGILTISWSPEVGPVAYQQIHAQALQSQIAFDSAVAGSAWGGWWGATVFTAAERGVFRARVQKTLP